MRWPTRRIIQKKALELGSHKSVTQSGVVHRHLCFRIHEILAKGGTMKAGFRQDRILLLSSNGQPNGFQENLR